MHGQGSVTNIYSTLHVVNLGSLGGGKDNDPLLS